MEKAYVFNIERASSEDGPGIRTVVFLKGCALGCRWCANPESQKFTQEVLVNTNICINCGKCVTLCLKNAITKVSDCSYITNSELCNQCGTCIDGCYMNARSIVGTNYTSKQLVEELLKDKEYFIASNGGVTFSGGEPLYHAEFIRECATMLKAHNISILIETCGYVHLEKIQLIADIADYIFYDIKHMNEEKHLEYTKASNRLILSNLIWLNRHYKGKLSIRCPIIPGLNDSKEEVEEVLTFVSSLCSVTEVWFLPYHRLGLPKYQGLGRTYEMGDMKSLRMKDIEYLKDYEEQYNIKIRI